MDDYDRIQTGFPRCLPNPGAWSNLCHVKRSLEEVVVFSLPFSDLKNKLFRGKHECTVNPVRQPLIVQLGWKGSCFRREGGWRFKNGSLVVFLQVALCWFWENVRLSSFARGLLLGFSDDISLIFLCGGDGS